MTYNASIPLASDSPSVFPAQSQANFTRLQTLVGADHQFNLTSAANDGYHNLVHLTQQAPAGALAATGRFYVKSSAGRIHMFYMDDTGAEYQLTPGMPIRASVSFTGTGALGAQVLRSQYNVATVVRTGTGLYTVNYTTPMPNDNYISMITGMRDGSGEVFSFIQGSATVATSQTTALLKIGFESSGGNAHNVTVGNVTIFSVT